MRDYVSQLPTSTPETPISEWCLKQHLINEDLSLHPNRGGVGKEIEQLANMSLINLVNVKVDLDLRHLNGDIKKKIQKIEADKKDGFATKQSKVEDYKNFVYDIPITLKEPIIAPKRLFDKSIVDEVV